MQKIIHSNKGFLLITSYMVMAVLLIFGAAFFARSISENNAARINQNSLAAIYAAQKGIECAYYEIKNYANQGLWVTHTVDPTDGSLQPLASPPPVSLSANNIFDLTNNFYRENTANTIFQVRTYADPNDADLVVVLSRGISGNIQRLFITKVSAHNMYDRFIFTPDDLLMQRQYWNANNGTIHANGDIIFGDHARAYNIGRLDTAQNFRYSVEPYVDISAGTGNEGCQTLTTADACSKWYLRYPWYNYNRTPTGASDILAYLNQPDGHISGDRYQTYRTAQYYPSPNPPFEPFANDALNSNPALPSENWPTRTDNEYPNIYSCKDGTNCTPPTYPYYSAQAIISNTTADKNIPNRLDALYYWYKYKDMTDTGALLPATPVPADTNYLPVKFTNSSMQTTAWGDYLARSEVQLTNVLHNQASVTALRPIRPPIEKYVAAAQIKGIYIMQRASDNKLVVTINGTNYVEGDAIYPLPNFIQKKTFMNAHSGRSDDIVRLNVGQMMNSPGLSPVNGIIYAKYGIALENAVSLPVGGLTVVGEENIIVQGPYNTATTGTGWQPSVAIGRKKIYTVSPDFNYPPALAAALHNLEFPYTIDTNYYNSNEGSMPNRVTTFTPYTDADNNDGKKKGYIQYNISLMGYYGFAPEALERWSYPEDMSSQIERRIQGNKVKLTNDWCDAACQASVATDSMRHATSGRSNPGWPWDMAAILGDSSIRSYINDKTIYEPRYVAGNPNYARPPGYALDDTTYAWLELNNTNFNFTHASQLILYQAHAAWPSS